MALKRDDIDTKFIFDYLILLTQLFFSINLFFVTSCYIGGDPSYSLVRNHQNQTPLSLLPW